MSFRRRNLLQAAVLAGGALVAKAKEPEGVDAAAFVSVFAKRQTVRRFKSTPIPDEHLTQILDAARRGPTCMNQQPWKFLVIRDQKKIQEMKRRILDAIAKRTEGAAGDARKQAVQYTEGILSAPVYVAVLVDTEAPCAGYALTHDGPIAAGYLMLAARAFGYGTAYLTDGIPEAIAQDVLGIPQRYKRICVTPIGVPDGAVKQAYKRKLTEMVAYETLEGHPPLERIPYNP